MASLCALKERHGVDLRSGYKNDQACTEFVEYIHTYTPSFLVVRAMATLTLETSRKSPFSCCTLTHMLRTARSTSVTDFSQFVNPNVPMQKGFFNVLAGTGRASLLGSVVVVPV